MKKRHTKKFILEAISYWKKQLSKLDEAHMHESIRPAGASITVEMTSGDNAPIASVTGRSFASIARQIKASTAWGDDACLEYNGIKAYLYDEDALAELLAQMDADAAESYGRVEATAIEGYDEDPAVIQFEFF